MKSSATFNPVLSAMFNQFFVNPAGFVALKLAPIFRTGEQSASYPVFPRGNYVDVPRLKARAPGSPFQRSVSNISDDSYACKNYGHETPVADETRKKYAKQIDADRAAMRRNAHTILVNHEIRVHDLYVSNAITSSSPAVKWDDYANAASDPVGDVKAIARIIELEAGMRPNLLTLPRLVVDKLTLHPKVRAFFPTYNGAITADMLRTVFEIDQIAVAGMVQNTAAEGIAESLDYLWGEDVILSVSNDVQDLEAPNAARSFLWDVPGESGGDEAGSFIETYRDDTVKSDIHRSIHNTDEKVTGEGMAYRLSNTLT